MSTNVAFKTLGCRLNQAETAAMAARFRLAGCEIVTFGTPCDVAIIHTCTITEAAERDCAKYARQARRKGATRVVLAGCAVERDAEAVRLASGADLVVGQADKLDLPAALGITSEKSGPEPLIPHFTITRALLKIQDGCSFRCAYCIVPDTRGVPRSRPLEDVCREATALADAGHKELVITGANIGCYKDGTRELPELLEALETIPGIVRLRISSIESTTVEHRIIDQMARSAKLCHFLHLPLQSGSDNILRAMRRRYCAADYATTARRATERIRPLGLGADIITGFPGETEEDFQQTLQLVEALPFTNLHVFPYSERPGTPAASMHGAVDRNVRRKRAAVLIDCGRKKRQQWLPSFIGARVRVIVERINGDGQVEGWTDTYARCRLPGRHLAVGDVCHARISAVSEGVLKGMPD